jgi:hypothetical protein
MTPAILDQLLEEAQAGFGLIVRTNNARRLLILLRNRIREHRSTHPAMYSGIMLLTSRSPLEIYIVNKEAASAWRNLQTSNPHPEGSL